MGVMNPINGGVCSNVRPAHTGEIGGKPVTENKSTHYSYLLS
jgi:hypothetical protein